MISSNAEAHYSTMNGPVHEMQNKNGVASSGSVTASTNRNSINLNGL